MRDALIRHETLITYRHFAIGLAGPFILCVGSGILLRKDTSLIFPIFMAFLIVNGLAPRLFDRHPEPTAKRQVATAMVVFAVSGVAGYFLVGASIRACLSLPFFAH
jgi:hypothetical protein